MYYLHFMYICVLECMYSALYICKYLQRLEEGIRFPVAGVIGYGALSDMGIENQNHIFCKNI